MSIKIEVRRTASESLLSKLSVKSGWHDVNTASGGVPEFDQADVVAALSRVDRYSTSSDKLTSALVLYLYTRADCYLHTAAAVLFKRREIRPMLAMVDDLDTRLKPCLLPMCYMSIDETLGGMSSVRCRSCRGRGQWKDPNSSATITCKYCSNGMQPAVKLTPRSRCRKISHAVTQGRDDIKPVSQYNWDKQLAALYGCLCEQVSIELSEGLSMLSRALRGD